MKAPAAIDLIYKELLDSYTTIIIIPRLHDALTRYELDPHNFIDRELSVKIYVPEGWQITSAMNAAPAPPDGGVRLLIQAGPSTLFRPRIELLVDGIGGVSLMDYFQQRRNDLQADGLKLLKSHVDEQFQVITLELLLNRPGADRTFQIHKYMIRSGQVYTVRVTGLSPAYIDQEPKLIDDLQEIVHSLSFIECPDCRRDQCSGMSCR